ncbi:MULTISPECIES: TraK family protein [Acidiphilium]|uniref:TraK family protein n=1 Tax=Acidiphilium iwatense TaxID=768198 RepID=A0ABS9E1W9_9PROT|nr:MULTISPECIES: TraK family protein [Acidiphilium]MCF3949006.1 TraK family protein [Acidiphilium iwatense]
MAEKTPPKFYGAARVAVRAMRDVIEAELAAGLTLKEIHQKYRDRCTVSYERFRIHISREITGTAGSRGGQVPLFYKQKPPSLQVRPIERDGNTHIEAPAPPPFQDQRSFPVSAHPGPSAS